MAAKAVSKSFRESKKKISFHIAINKIRGVSESESNIEKSISPIGFQTGHSTDVSPTGNQTNESLLFSSHGAGSNSNSELKLFQTNPKFK